MATTTSLAYTSYTALTNFTALNGLAATDGLDHWMSDMVDNTTTKYVDILAGGVFKVGTTPASGAISVYVIGQYDIATAAAMQSGYNDALSATADVNTVLDTATTIEAVVANMTLLASVTQDDGFASDVTYHWGPVSVGSAFGGIPPEKFAFVVHNGTAAALNASGNSMGIIGIKYTSE